ncbi:hypothetical protein [Candidatus Venteria ishoeyi]|uniref:hypothetical protein n=1 Tax=Candidatus Venteria ishoeyi TaxID=1899563 RepID=UPI0015AD7A31|nr:hypothetical protein [Candidatus Venteria ishoeyi]
MKEISYISSCAFASQKMEKKKEKTIAIIEIKNQIMPRWTMRIFIRKSYVDKK